ncbi:SGNH/GDSL hydrolase family protein [Nesterenkonia sp. HG001]|uniref:SGNH/GDSL hydrolase family protein n=1 Tax=Nesterenkonia sp. HG001 TaxID=2983207 RepID=UPI002AC42F8D|nr:lipase [Nesterenkonia sp. HG001]
MIATPISAEFIHGTTELEHTARGIKPHRLPQATRERHADQQLSLMETQPSGVRLEFTTEARSITLDIHSTRVTYRGLQRARGAVDVVVDGADWDSRVLAQGDQFEFDMETGHTALVEGAADLVQIDGLPHGEKFVELWLPHNEAIELTSMHSDQPLSPREQTRPVWVHHGSSISHGSNSISPSRIWPAVAAKRANVSLHNFGFGGSAFADPFMARVIRDTSADFISVKLGINIVNADAMRLRAFVPAVHGFLDTIREGHPTTPILLISPIFCGIHEETPGPGAIDPESFGTGTARFTATGRPGDTEQGRLTLQVIRTALKSLVDARTDDPNLSYLDGLRLYGQKDAERLPLSDSLHPDTASHELIGERFAVAAFGRHGLFSGPSPN